jgi:P4 family phage/plasmid primase-like protien
MRIILYNKHAISRKFKSKLIFYCNRMVNHSTENLRVIKKNLQTPKEFKKTSHENNACFSYNYKLYGSLESWDLAWDKLKDLPHNENIFHELILENTQVKPYLDVEWFQEKFPDTLPEKVILHIKECMIDIFKNEWSYKLNSKDIYVATCHRKKTEGYKFSFRVVVASRGEDGMIVFENTNGASYLARRIRKLCVDYFNEEIIDMSVYKKTQNIRIIGHCKAGEYVPMQKVNYSDDDKEFIITNIDPRRQIIQVPEQKDLLYKNIKNGKNIDLDNPDILNFVMEKIKSVHPTCIIERVDSNNFMQMNYEDRSEPCFCSDERTHDRIGFFCYIQDDLIKLGCHSGNCVDGENKKIIKILGSITTKNNNSCERVHVDNNFNLDHAFIKKCIINGSRGVSSLMEHLYLTPKRLKWIDDSKTGSRFYWDGDLWKQDVYFFIEKLVSVVSVKILRDFKNVYNNNTDDSVTVDVDDEIMKEASSIIRKLNEGSNLTNILRFLIPVMNDPLFIKLKDVHPYMLSCKNGLVDLKTGELRERIPDDNITKCVDIIYDEKSNMDEFDNFVRQITSSETGPDIELYNYIRWSMGYALQGSPVKKMFFILYGEKGYNGKSLFLNSIKNVLEFYAVAMDKSIVVNTPGKTGGSHSTEICQLENSRLGILSETKEDDVINDGQMKQLTGITDKLSVREIYGKQKEFTPTFVPFISSNHKLKINLKDQAMYERLILIPFRLSFMENPNTNNKWEKKGDNLLAEKFEKNKEGILNWLIQCSLYYHKNYDMSPPEVVMKAKQEYRKEMDDYAEFISRNVVYTQNNKDFVILIDLVKSYKEFCSEFRIPYERRKAERMIHDCLLDHHVAGKYVGCLMIDE